jgi:hypothetical protein
MSGIVQIDEYGLAEFIEDTDGLLQIIEQLRGGGGTRLNRKEIHGFMEALMKRAGKIYQTYSITQELTVHRAIRLSTPEDPKSRSDLGPPPHVKVERFGRCHQPYEPVCYCSLYEDTALAELDAQAGEFFSISTFSIGNSVLMPIGEFDYYRRTGQTRLGQAIPTTKNVYKNFAENENKKQLIHSQVIDAFVAEAFIRHASTDADYKITNTFCKILFDEFPDKIDAFLYPSVAFREGLNFAFSISAYQTKLKLRENETKIIKITSALGFGIYEYEDIYVLERVNSNDALEWKRKTNSPK